MTEQLNYMEVAKSDDVDSREDATDAVTRNTNIVASATGRSATPDADARLNYWGDTEVSKSGPKNDTGIITTLGYSKKLGTSVLTELDSRTSEMLEALKEDVSTSGIIGTPSEYAGQTVPSYGAVFNTIHDSQFQKMDSLDHYYSTFVPSSPTTASELQRHNRQDSGSGTAQTSTGTAIRHSSVPPETPRKNPNTSVLESESVKRMKLEDSTVIVPKTPVPISDITRRIRRLRLRNSLMSPSSPSIADESKNSIRYKPLSDSKQKSMKPPSFLMPTITSMNRMRKPVSFSPLASTTQTKPGWRQQQQQQRQQQSKSTTERHGNLSRSVPMQRPNKQSSVLPATNKNSSASGPKQHSDNQTQRDSVFDRLYRQTTISRSMSMNSVAQRREGHSGSTATNPRMGTSKIAFGRSKTQGSLSSHLTGKPYPTSRGSNTGSNANSGPSSISSQTRRHALG